MAKPVVIYVSEEMKELYEKGKPVFGYSRKSERHNQLLLVHPDHIVREQGVAGHPEMGKIYSVWKRKKHRKE